MIEVEFSIDMHDKDGDKFDEGLILHFNDTFLLKLADLKDLDNLIKQLSNIRKEVSAELSVSIRFSIMKTILSDFALFAIVDNELNKVVCHLLYDNGEDYCEEMANKMLAGLNGC